MKNVSLRMMKNNGNQRDNVPRALGRQKNTLKIRLEELFVLEWHTLYEPVKLSISVVRQVYLTKG